MGSLFLGILAGIYIGNPQARATVDAQIKKAVGQGIDYLNANGNGAVIDAPQEANGGE